MDYNHLLECINTIGKLLLRHGAEIYRVEESLDRLCEAYDFTEIEVFAIPTYFALSLTLPDGTPYHSSRRSRSNRIHLDNLYDMNNLVRYICENKPDPRYIQEQLDLIQSHQLNLYLICVGYVISSAMFCGFFGGKTPDMVVAGLIGLILYFFIYILEKLRVNSLVRTLVASMLLSYIAITAVRLGYITQAQSSITGSLMLLVPGIAMTNSLRDIMGGDYVSGVSRMAEAILIAASIAIGVGMMMLLFGGVY